MNQIARYIGIFVIYVILQVLLFNNFTLASQFTPHVFLLFLLMLPNTMPYAVTILIAFFAGFTVDLLSVSLPMGLHAFASVFMITIRNPWISVITNRIAFRGNEDILLYIQPYLWYVSYLFPLIIVHHLIYYFLESFGFQAVSTTLLKALGSSVYTFVWCILGTFLIYKRSGR